MSRYSPAGFALGAGTLSAVATAVLVLFGRAVGEDTSTWPVMGFLAMALPAVACGTWLAREHGRTRSWFLVAMGTGWVLRAVLLAAVVVAALRRGPGALAGALTGLAVGFIALTTFEMLWFSRRTRRGSVSTERGA